MARLHSAGHVARQNRLAEPAVSSLPGSARQRHTSAVAGSHVQAKAKAEADSKAKAEAEVSWPLAKGQLLSQCGTAVAIAAGVS